MTSLKDIVYGLEKHLLWLKEYARCLDYEDGAELSLEQRILRFLSDGAAGTVWRIDHIAMAVREKVPDLLRTLTQLETKDEVECFGGLWWGVTEKARVKGL